MVLVTFPVISAVSSHWPDDDDGGGGSGGGGGGGGGGDDEASDVQISF